MNEPESKQIVEPTDTDEVVLAADISDDAMRGVFRLLFAGDNLLTELYAGSIVVTPKDIFELYDSIISKLAHYKMPGLTFSAVVSYENSRSQEYGSFERFRDENWNSADVLDSISIWWKFLILFPDSHQPELHSINLRVSSSISTQHLIQAIFSKDPEEFEKFDQKMVPMSCRIDFVDHILIQELLDIVSKWRKALRNPGEYVFPVMRRIKEHSSKIRDAIRTSVPFLSALACVGYFYDFSRNKNAELPVTTGFLTETVYWLVATGVIIYFANGTARRLGQYAEKQLDTFGDFRVLEFTKGDKKRQTKLQAKSQNSFWKFVVSALFAVLWNIVGAWVAVRLISD